MTSRTLPPRPRPDAALRPEFAWIDLEASSLEQGSFPIEVGIARNDLTSESWLIRPHSTWSRSCWSSQSQGIHGISWERLQDEGRDVRVVAEELNARLSSSIAFSDAVEFELYWLSTLFEAAGVPMGFPVADEAEALLRHLAPTTRPKIDEIRQLWSAAKDLSERIFPHTHRAADDALEMAASFRMTVDADVMARVDALDASLGRMPGLYGRHHA